MNHLLKLSLALCLLFAGTSLFAENYIVKKGDTLAGIARTRYGEPVFGPRGSLKRLLKMNPGLKSTVALEPGQKITLEDKMSEYPQEKIRSRKAPPVPIEAAEPEPPLPPADGSNLMTPAERAAHEMDLKPKGPLPEAQEPMRETPPPVHEAPPPLHEMHEFHEEAAAPSRPPNYFMFIAAYSIISQSATDNTTNLNYTLHSSPAWGATLGWDHWWNDSFSTVLTYQAYQFTSKESSDVTGSKILKNVNLNRTQLALLNRVIPWLRFGVGFAYGDHLFLENISGIPSNPGVYKMSYLNPFLTGEFIAYQNARFEGLVNVKIAQLPAQVGFGHDVAAGTEYFAQLSLLQKFAKFSMLYGVGYSTENQTRTDANEVRKEWALSLGALF